MKRDISWIKLLAEGAAIVASILLAFAIDAWWSAQQDRADEAVIIAALKSEFSGIQSELANNQTQAYAMQDSARRLLDHSRNPTSEVSDEQIDFWLNDTTWSFGGGDSPVIESLVLGGRLSLLSNRELRSLLVKWPPLIDYFSGNALRSRAFLDQHYLPYLRANASIAQIYAADDGQPGHPHRLYPYGSEIEGFTPISHRDLIQQREFQNLLIDRIAYLNEIIGYGSESETAEEIAEIMLILERE